MSAREDLAAINPRLMTRAEAKRYCRGVDPHLVTPPLRFGRRVLWDKVAIDEALDEQRRKAAAAPAPGADASDAGTEDELERARKRFKKGPVSGR